MLVQPLARNERRELANVLPRIKAPTSSRVRSDVVLRYPAMRAQSSPSLACSILVAVTTLPALIVQGCAHAGTPVRGRVVEARLAGGVHEVPDTVFDVELVNGGEQRCELSNYAVIWGSGVLAGRARCDAKVVLPSGGTSRQTCVVSSGSQLGATPGLESPRVVDIGASCEATR